MAYAAKYLARSKIVNNLINQRYERLDKKYVKDRDQREFDYKKLRDSIVDSHWKANYDENMRYHNEMLNKQDMTYQHNLDKEHDKILSNEAEGDVGNFMAFYNQKKADTLKNHPEIIEGTDFRGNAINEFLRSKKFNSEDDRKLYEDYFHTALGKETLKRSALNGVKNSKTTRGSSGSKTGSYGSKRSGKGIDSSIPGDTLTSDFKFMVEQASNDYNDAFTRLKELRNAKNSLLKNPATASLASNYNTEIDAAQSYFNNAKQKYDQMKRYTNSNLPLNKAVFAKFVEAEKESEKVKTEKGNKKKTIDIVNKENDKKEERRQFLLEQSRKAQEEYDNELKENTRMKNKTNSDILSKRISKKNDILNYLQDRLDFQRTPVGKEYKMLRNDIYSKLDNYKKGSSKEDIAHLANQLVFDTLSPNESSSYSKADLKRSKGLVKTVIGLLNAGKIRSLRKILDDRLLTNSLEKVYPYEQ